ncbi:hypothetical protein BC962_2059 [Gillisia mitskevichiae]|uniref:Uncharacterized protein n=1 Tax=Gillisia mitskevichiae TaxID=270921 RepID=A0A495PW74_9FLAO|nr:hypothetical protein [Gillisia mitskevichiae]RKS53802.1 hypothetical protein BC962_2059 [Gillisia mitskevichiae]
MKEIIYNKIIEKLNSNEFESRLKNITRNYPNLKQEIQIRNCLLEMINAEYFTGEFNYRAFAELKHINFPRKRVDLTFINQESNEERYTVELKFQYSNDFLRFHKYKHIIQNDFELRNSELFILIVAHWSKEEKKKFDEKWFDEKFELAPNLNRYISNEKCWKENIPNLLGTFNESNCEDFISLEIEVEDEFNPKMNYDFYFLRRNFMQDIKEVKSALN